MSEINNENIYTRHQWILGEPITKEKMNNIENGIDKTYKEIMNAINNSNESENSLLDQRPDAMQAACANNLATFKNENDQDLSELQTQISTNEQNRRNMIRVTRDFQEEGIKDNSNVQICLDQSQEFTPISIPDWNDFKELLFSIASQYDTTKKYVTGDYVIHESKLYKCEISNISEIHSYITGEWNAENWNRVNITDSLYITIKLNWQEGYIINSGDNLSLAVNTVFTNFEHIDIDCVEGDIFEINAYSGSVQKPWSFLDSANNVIICSNAYNKAKVLQRIIAPKGAVRLIINNRFGDDNNGIVENQIPDARKLQCYRIVPLNDAVKQLWLQKNNNAIDLLFWGDSLTQGGTTKYPQVCAKILGTRSFKNCGVGGESANTIACRQGGNTMIIKPEDLKPISDSNQQNQQTSRYRCEWTKIKDVFGASLNPRNTSGGTGNNEAYLNGQKVQLQTHPKELDNQGQPKEGDAGKNYLDIIGYNPSEDPMSNYPLMMRCIGSEFNGKVVIIFVGTNGATIGDVNNTPSAHIAIIDSMLAHIPHNQVVIIGRFFKEEELTQDSSAPATYESVMLQHYGAKFFPARRMLINYGTQIAAEIVENFTPDPKDTEDKTNGLIPRSLRADFIHLNDSGYQVLGTLLAQKIQSLGYTFD